MTTQEFISALVARLNVQIDLPFLSESQEATLIEWCVAKVAHFIPDSIRNFILDASDGLSPEEIVRLEDVLVGFLADKIDIPWVPESMEASLIRPVVQSVLDLAKQGVSIHSPA